MGKAGILLSSIFLLGLFMLFCPEVKAESDSFYQMSEVTQPAWDGTYSSNATAPTSDYDYAYGDDESVTFNLPWAFTFYGQGFNKITADTNGNIWFAASDTASSINLSFTGRGPVISAWNNDLSSAFTGGVYVQHKTNPERIVVEWQTETYTEEGLELPNTFEVVIFPDGSIRYDYGNFGTQNGADFGSGTSVGDGSSFLSITNVYGNVFSLSGRSFLFAPKALFTITVSKDGLGSGSITSSPPGISCGSVCSGTFAQGSTILLTAIPDFGSELTAWSGACSGTGNCTLSIDSAKTVIATISPTYAPAIVINSPSGVMASHTPVLSFAVSTGTPEVKLDGTVINKVSGDALDAVADGTHVLRVEATNSLGHLGFAESSFTVDSTPPVVTLLPANGATNVPVRMSVLVGFSEPVDPASVNSGMLSLTSGGVPIPGSYSLSTDRKSLIFTPSARLTYAATYSFTFKAGARDLVGNTVNSDLTTTFSTPILDPDLVGYWPMDGDWKDYSASAQNGTAYGSATFADGRASGGASGNFVIDSGAYSGSGGFVETPAGFVPSAPNTFTISFWAKPTATRAPCVEEELTTSLRTGQRYAIAPTFVYDFIGGAGVSIGTNGIRGPA